MTIDERRERVAKTMDEIKKDILDEFPYVDEKFVGKIVFTFHIQTGSVSGEPEITKRGKVIRF